MSSFETNFKEISGLLDESTNITHELANGFEEYDILLDWQFLKQAQTHNYNDLQKSLGLAINVINHSDALIFLQDARRHLLNYISGNYVVMTNLFLEIQNLRRSHEFDEIVLGWKTKRSCRLIQKIRNRLQHGKLLRESLNFEIRTAHHEEGESQDAFLSLAESTWNAIQTDLSREDSNYLEELRKHEGKALKILLEEYRSDCETLFNKMEEKFKAVYTQELAARENLLVELEKIETKLSKLEVGQRL